MGFERRLCDSAAGFVTTTAGPTDRVSGSGGEEQKQHHDISILNGCVECLSQAKPSRRAGPRRETQAPKQYPARVPAVRW
jgi:hypothetical protein